MSRRKPWRQGQHANLRRLLSCAQILAGPPLKFLSSAVQSVGEAALAWEVGQQVLPGGCQVLDDRDSPLQKCWREHISVYVGQFEFVLTSHNCYRLYCKSCTQGLLEQHGSNWCSHLYSSYTLTRSLGLTTTLGVARVGPGMMWQGIKKAIEDVILDLWGLNPGSHMPYETLLDLFNCSVTWFLIVKWGSQYSPHRSAVKIKLIY